MNILRISILAVFIGSHAFARDFRPAWHLENIPAGDASIQQCYVLQTTPGVRYTVESTNDLSTWISQDEHYGIGSEYVVTMREFTPPPPPPPGTPPANPPSPATNVSPRIQRASGTAGGSVVSWPSLDHGGPMIVRIAGEMDLAWSSIPIFSNRFGAYNFFFWHPGVAVAPPAENPPLGPKDTAMLAVLEASVPEINLQIAASIVLARNAPLPAPPDPNSKRFWRVKVDADIDTDQDGSPDWAEFEIATRGTGMLVSGVTGDPFDADTNNDGIPDGQQLDADLDGTPDATDSDAAESTVTFSLFAPMPRYALFPITNAGTLPGFPTVPNKPLQISDRGTVLYSNGTWAGGVWTPLPTAGGQTKGFTAGAINDHNQILGQGRFTLPEKPNPFSLICVWPSPAGVPALVSKANPSGTIYAVINFKFGQGILTPGPVLGNDGEFLMPASGFEEDVFKYLHHSQWKVPPGGGTITEESAAPGLLWNKDGVKWGGTISGLEPWGEEIGASPVEGMVTGSGTIPNLSFVPMNIAHLGGGSLLAMPPAESNEKARVLSGAVWEESPLYADVTDISLEGVAIGRTRSLNIAPLLINGKWQVISNYAPHLPELWNSGSTRLLDTTPNGWTLAEKGVWPLLGISYPENAVLLPIRTDGVDPEVVPPTGPPAPGAPAFDPPEYPYGGVDHTSLSAIGGNGRVPEIWIMAPNGGASNSVRFQSPLNLGCKLTLVSDDNVGFTPGELDQKDMIVQVKGKKTATEDFPAQLKLGGTLESETTPVKIKAMKRRAVKVAVHKVFGIDGNGNQTAPANFPAKKELDDYLNEIYGRQVNTFFDCEFYDEKGPSGNGIDFDFANGTSDLKIGQDSTDLEVQALTVNSKATGDSNATANIDIWIFGGGVRITDSIQSKLGCAFGGEFEGKIMIDGDLLGEQGQPERLSDLMLNTIAHEIGHVFVGFGHADDGSCRSVLVWKLLASGAYQRDFRNDKRLMKSSATRDFSSKKQLIKKEWDLIEAWLNAKIKDEEE